MRYASPTLKDVLHLGPKGDRNISGACSACGVTLLVWLQDSEEPSPALADRLEQLFTKHVKECHTPVAPLRVATAADLPKQPKWGQLCTPVRDKPL